MKRFFAALACAVGTLCTLLAPPAQAIDPATFNALQTQAQKALADLTTLKSMLDALSVDAPTLTNVAVSPATITAGQSATITATVTNATTISIGGAPVTLPYVVKPTTTTTYSVMATGPGGSISASVTVTVTAPPPPPPATTGAPASWPVNKPDLLDLDLTSQDAIFAAKWLDPALQGWDTTATSPAASNWGRAIHYGDMAGSVDSWSPFLIPGKLSGLGVAPVWGTEANGLHYLESGSDGRLDPYGTGTGQCGSCRVINWQLKRFSYPELYYRVMVYVYPETLANTTELGIKMSGPTGVLVTGGTYAEIFELGDKRTVARGNAFPLQAYRYDAENLNSGVTLFPDVAIAPGAWHVYEGHVKAPSRVSTTTTVDAAGRAATVIDSSADGVIEFKVDGRLVYARNDVKMGNRDIQGFAVQLYHGGVKKPAGIIRFKSARIALSRSNWIGPPIEVANDPAFLQAAGY